MDLLLDVYEHGLSLERLENLPEDLSYGHDETANSQKCFLQKINYLLRGQVNPNTARYGDNE